MADEESPESPFLSKLYTPPGTPPKRPPKTPPPPEKTDSEDDDTYVEGWPKGYIPAKEKIIVSPPRVWSPVPGPSNWSPIPYYDSRWSPRLTHIYDESIADMIPAQYKPKTGVPKPVGTDIIYQDYDPNLPNFLAHDEYDIVVEGEEEYDPENPGYDQGNEEYVPSGQAQNPIAYYNPADYIMPTTPPPGGFSPGTLEAMRFMSPKSGSLSPGTLAAMQFVSPVRSPVASPQKPSSPSQAAYSPGGSRLSIAGSGVSEASATSKSSSSSSSSAPSRVKRARSSSGTSILSAPTSAKRLRSGTASSGTSATSGSTGTSTGTSTSSPIRMRSNTGDSSHSSLSPRSRSASLISETSAPTSDSSAASTPMVETPHDVQATRWRAGAGTFTHNNPDEPVRRDPGRFYTAPGEPGDPNPPSPFLYTPPGSPGKSPRSSP